MDFFLKCNQNKTSRPSENLNGNITDHALYDYNIIKHQKLKEKIVIVYFRL